MFDSSILFELLEENNITVNQLSQDLNMVESHVIKWKKCAFNPTTYTLNKLSDYLDVSVDYLLGRTKVKQTYNLNSTPFLVGKNGRVRYLDKETSNQILELLECIENKYKSNMTDIPELFELLEENNITMTELSKDVNISIEMLSNWKRGNSYPSPHMLNKLADYFDVSVDYLLGKTGVKKPGSLISQPFLTGKSRKARYLGRETSNQILELLEYIENKYKGD